MTARVYFKPKGCQSALAFEELGHTDNGAWGLVKDAAWMTTPGASAVELLYTSEAQYRHAMRRLPEFEIAPAIQRRRTTFWEDFDEHFLSLLQDALWLCINSTGDDERGFALRTRLVTIHAKLIHANQYGRHSAEWMAALVDEEVDLVTELESKSLRPVTSRGHLKEECTSRRHFVAEMASLAGRAHPDRWPSRTVERVYAVQPVTPSLLEASRDDDGHQTGFEWQDRLLVALHDSEAEHHAKMGREVKPVLAMRGQLTGFRHELTPAQLDVELEEQLANPDFSEWIQSGRISALSLLEAARLCTTSQREFNALIARRCESELRQFPRWSKQPRPPAHTRLAAGLDEAIHLANLLAAVERAKRQPDDAATAKTVSLRLGEVRKAL